jgi:two-component system, OmpR family, alkaline phosphatase synthesis response regulator PhoP
VAKERVLIIEDDDNIRELLQYNLQREGYLVTGLPSGENTLVTARAQHPDIILLDLMLPGIDGLSVCKMLKADAATAAIPVVMVTAKGEEADVVVGLELGADDYIIKPFSPKVLVARVRAVLRRKTVASHDDATAPLQIGGLSIHPGRRELLIDGKPVELTFTEFQLLHFLAGRPGWVFTRYQIVDAIKGEDYPVTDRSVDVQVVGLRKKLGPYSDYIETIRGIGYRFTDRESEGMDKQ